MAKGVTTRSTWQEAAKRHAKFSKEHPEWMGQANEALKPWGEQEFTLQHAVALALKKAYEAGARGEYPKPIDYFDRYKEQDETEDHGGSGARVVRRRNVAKANGHVGGMGGDTGHDAPAEEDNVVVPATRRQRSNPAVKPVIRRRS